MEQLRKLISSLSLRQQISIGAALIVVGVGLWVFTKWSIEKTVVRSVLLFVPLAPTLTLFSRVLWIYLDRSIDPE